MDNLKDLSFKGQFILTCENKSSPKGWKEVYHQEWKLFTSDLPVINVYNEENVWFGWCIGHPIVDGKLEPQIIKIRNSEEADDFEGFYERTSGKWILIILEATRKSIYLDPMGALSMVYSTKEKTVASTPSLIGLNDDWQTELMIELNFPDDIEWLPFGLTFKKNIIRLIPNHFINLNNWIVTRHWPKTTTDLTINENTSLAVQEVISNIKKSINAISANYPICLTLTSGRDSRTVLACTVDTIKNVKVVTFAKEKQTVEMYIAKKIANELNLNYEFLNIVKASSNEIENWLYLTGFSVSGEISKIHKTLEKLDKSSVLLPGLSAELHKGIKWNKADNYNTPLSVEELLKRWKIPYHPIIIKAAEEWLLEVKNYNTLQKLDLFHIEQRLACWAAPAYYGNTISKFEIPLFNNRNIIQIMMKLPITYRRNKQLTIDIFKETYPQLLKFPFNEYTGLFGYFRSKAKRFKNWYLKYS